PRPAHEPGLGPHSGDRHWHRDRPRPPTPREDRRRSRAPSTRPDRVGRGVPVLSVIALALTVAAGTLLAGAAGSFAIRLLPTIHGRLIAITVLAAFVLLPAVLLSGVAMFHLGAVVVILAVAAAAASIAVAVALVVTAAIC